MKNYFIFFIFLIPMGCFMLSKKSIHESINCSEDSISTITLSFVGDLMCHSPQFKNAEISTDSFDFTPSFEEVKNYLESSDFTIGNLETTCAGKKIGYSGYPAFNTPDEFITALKESGFDLLVTANNHSMDTNEKGLLRTIDVIKKNKLRYTGTFNSKRDHDSIRIITLKGIQIAILNYTYGTNGLYPSKKHSYMLNLIDTSAIKKDIEQSRKKGSEIVIVYYHFGIENNREPTKEQEEIVKKTRLYGADIIIGAHPHVIGKFLFFKTNKAKLDTGFVAYSLGNFISNQYWRYADAGIILTISLTKKWINDSIYISNVDYIPTWVYRGTNEKKKMHIVFPLVNNLDSLEKDFIDSLSIKKMKEAFIDTKEIFFSKAN